jgi:uncharacterized protein (DUF1499 family)
MLPHRRGVVTIRFVPRAAALPGRFPIRRGSRPAIAAAALAFAACAGPLPNDLGVRDGRLAPCPASPNCVASDADDAQHAIAPLVYTGSAEDAWRAAREAVATLPRSEIFDETNGYLRAECTTALMRYVDDLELQLHASTNSIAVRSASRVGYSDMGANRSRVEELRQLFESRLD